MVDRDPVGHWVHGSVALIGDAAHPMYPIGSNGASQAIVDSRVLGTAFVEHGVGRDALRADESALLTDRSALVLRNRGAGPFSVLGLVDERCGGVFDNIDDVVPHEEIGQIMASYKAAAGRIFRIEDITDFSPNSGLVDDESSYVASLDISYRDWAEVRTSWRFSDDFGIERADILASSSYDSFSIYASYFFVEKDAAINSSINRSELTLGGSAQLDRNWSLSANARRDLIADRFVTAGAILSYVNECGGFDAFVKRRFTESVSAPEATTFGLRVRLFGAGGGDQSRASGACAYGAE